MIVASTIVPSRKRRPRSLKSALTSRKDGLGQIVLLQQVAEVEQRRGIGHRFAAAQLDAHKRAQRLAVIERIFQGLVGQRIPLLQKVHAQHPLDAHRRAGPVSPLG